MVENGYTVYSHTTPSAKIYFGITKQKAIDGGTRRNDT